MDSPQEKDKTEYSFMWGLLFVCRSGRRQTAAMDSPQEDRTEYSFMWGLLCGSVMTIFLYM
jgi:hypothetical protein